ncbi:peptidyl-prolyl cis-trans isomerase [Aquipluma nitroreducens]|uniref:Peptidyl-prolyl cis-trans isomerase n=1 Tax=Aquipluma nitroreducens TaxID=2010828 RepID=A0A5K7SHD4_9BACT|nr:FKBP-type peptidyl-prolyl cis-trans isomerase [Aquipluma nitroreducens]BBE20887.1 peptidyl-prolyl cis-trans isomerase [Aquipluma nitroreducens]
MSDYQFKDKLEEFSYSLGLTISSNLIQSGVKEINSLQFLAGLQDTYAGNKPKISMDDANHNLQEFMLANNDEEANRNLEKGLLYLLNNVHNEGVVETESGLQYKILKEGYGKSPTIDDQIKCDYHGILLDGTVFDSTIERRQPAIFPVNAVIRGWAEALLLMTVGAKWRLFIPSNLAYGEEGTGGLIGPNATLIFDVELLEIV